MSYELTLTAATLLKSNQLYSQVRPIDRIISLRINLCFEMNLIKLRREFF